MKYLFILLLASAPVVVVAYNPILAEPVEQYAHIPIEGDPYTERNYLGDLEGIPDLYVIRSEVAFDLTVALKQKATDTPLPFSLIIVRDRGNNGGVEEIVRQNIAANEWQTDYNVALGIPFLVAPTLTESVEAGTYWIEVSTPTNGGNYMLVVGDESVQSNPFRSFIAVFLTQSHFDILFLFRLLSPYVFIPFAFLLAFVIWFRRQWKKA